MTSASPNVREALDNAGAAYVRLSERAVVLSRLFELLGAGPSPDSSGVDGSDERDERFWRGVHSMIAEITDAADTMNETIEVIVTSALRKAHDSAMDPESEGGSRFGT